LPRRAARDGAAVPARRHPLLQMGQAEQAGDEYLAVGHSSGKRQQEALLKAMDAVEELRQKSPSAVDKKVSEAADLYMKAFPNDPKMIGIVFRQGQMFYDAGDYDDAVKQFGLIVTNFPNDPNSGPAGDRILDALNKAADYENVEEWGRKLKSAKAFSSTDQQ